MPELPEVETTVRGLSSLVAAQCIQAHACGKALRWMPDASALARLANQRVLALKRRAKFALIEFEKDTLAVHLGMSGSLRLDPVGAPLRLHDHFEIRFGECWLRLNDPRRFGGVLMAARGTELTLPSLAKLGIEPLSEAFHTAFMHEKSSNKNTPVKALLMDQEVVVGIGNIYASEALFSAKVDPRKPAGKVSKAKWTRIVDETQRILTHAIAQGGSTLRDFKHVNGQSGKAQDLHRVYAKAGQPCPLCSTAIEQAVIGGRNSFFCRKCQK